MNLEKFKNSLYKNIKTNIVIDTKVVKNDNSDTKLKNKEKNVEEKKHKEISASIESNKQISSPKSVDKIQNYDVDLNYSPLLPRGKSLLISNPYGASQTRIEYEENLKKKQKWLNKNGFVNNISKHLNNYIEMPTCVWQSPAAVPIQKYQYRDVNREKWVSKKEFIYKNSHDLII